MIQSQLATVTASRGSFRQRSGFTLIELIVVIGVIGLLAALLMPAVLASRESARRMACGNHLHQFGVAISNYESAYGCFPPAGLGDVKSYAQCVLPYVEGTEEVLRCPSDPGAQERRINYCGNAGSGLQRYGFNGFFRYQTGFPPYDDGGMVRPADITDGLSQTAAISEAIIGGPPRRLTGIWHVAEHIQPWELDLFAMECATLPADPEAAGISGGEAHWGHNFLDFNLGQTLYNHVLPPNTPRCINGQQYQLSSFPAGSYHPGGAQTVYGDGRVDFTSENVDRDVWRSRGSRNGGD